MEQDKRANIKSLISCLNEALSYDNYLKTHRNEYKYLEWWKSLDNNLAYIDDALTELVYVATEED